MFVLLNVYTRKDDEIPEYKLPEIWDKNIFEHHEDAVKAMGEQVENAMAEYYCIRECGVPNITEGMNNTWIETKCCIDWWTIVEV